MGVKKLWISKYLNHFPLPFTLLNRIFYLALIRSGFPFNRVNPPHRWRGDLLDVFTPLEIMPRWSAAGLDFRIIPAGFNAPLEFLTGFTHLEGCIGKHLCLTF